MRDDRRILVKIIGHCNDIEDALQYFGRDEEDFLGNKFFQKSCILDIFQIGEAVKSLSFGLTNENRDIPWKEIAGFRNLIAHDYERVSLKDTWIAVTEEAPELKIVCERILAGLTDQ
ncbi:MAG: DUF86 domain-containing protein [Methanomassiliicoccaceae archaeon]|nr:DUF86 domain-containing protein [Methanomassiliicoccaceae archaeon]